MTEVALLFLQGIDPTRSAIWKGIAIRNIGFDIQHGSAIDQVKSTHIEHPSFNPLEGHRRQAETVRMMR